MGQVFSCGPCFKNRRESEPLDFNIGVEIKKDKQHNDASDNESDIDIKLNSSSEKLATKPSSTAASANEIENIEVSPRSEKNDRISIIGSSVTNHKIDKLEDDDTKRNKLEKMVTKNDDDSAKNIDNVEFVEKTVKDHSDIPAIEDKSIVPIGDEEKATKEDLNTKESSKKTRNFCYIKQ